MIFSYKGIRYNCPDMNENTAYFKFEDLNIYVQAVAWSESEPKVLLSFNTRWFIGDVDSPEARYPYAVKNAIPCLDEE
jgi:hypothetical protein